MKRIIFEGGSNAVADILCVLKNNKIYVDINNEFKEVLYIKDNQLFETEENLFPSGTTILTVSEEKIYKRNQTNDPLMKIIDNKLILESSSSVIATLGESKVYYGDSTQDSEVMFSIDTDFDFSEGDQEETSSNLCNAEYVALWHFFNNHYDYNFNIDDFEV
jgi:hypothetical protein